MLTACCTDISKHSRAARRATSPSINTDRSLKDVSLPTSAPSASSTKHNSDGKTEDSSSNAARPSVLAAHRSAGVQKRKAKPGRRVSARARRRAQKGAEMAEAVLERTSRKVRISEGKIKTVKDRSKAWDAINRFAVVGDEGGDDAETEEADGDGGAWETDEDMDGDADVGGEADVQNGRIDDPTSVVQGDEDGDVIL